MVMHTETMKTQPEGLEGVKKEGGQLMEFIEIKKWEGTENYYEALEIATDIAMDSFIRDTWMILRLESTLLERPEDVQEVFWTN